MGSLSNSVPSADNVVSTAASGLVTLAKLLGIVAMVFSFFPLGLIALLVLIVIPEEGIIPWVMS